MSRASERAQVGRALATYSLMGVGTLAAFLGVSHGIAMCLVRDGTIPSVPVGRRRLVDPLDAIVHVLAGREGCTAKEYWEKHGEAVPELARGHYTRIMKLKAGAA